MVTLYSIGYTVGPTISYNLLKLGCHKWRSKCFKLLGQWNYEKTNYIFEMKSTMDNSNLNSEKIVNQ